MNGGADLGGMMGFGPVAEEPNEPLFHAPWEARVMGMVVALGASGQWNLDQSRFARESLPTADYLRWPYYRIWLEGVQKLMLGRGMVTEEELASGAMIVPPVPVKGTLAAARVADVLSKGGPVDRPATTGARFAPGDAIRTINHHPDHHTRLPRYARDKPGTIRKIHGAHVFPDSNAKGDGEDPRWLYQVAFAARDLWGDRGGAADVVTLDMWEPYLRPDLRPAS